VEQKFPLLGLTDGLKAEYGAHQLQGPAGIWWNQYQEALSDNTVLDWNLFHEAFKGHLSPWIQWQPSPSIVFQFLTSDMALQRRRIRRRQDSARVTLLLFQGATRALAMPRLHMPIVLAGIVIRPGTSKATVLTRQRRATKGTSARGVFTIQLWKQSLLVR